MIRLLIAACESISMDSDTDKSTGEKHRWNIHYDAAMLRMVQGAS